MSSETPTYSSESKVEKEMDHTNAEKPAVLHVNDKVAGDKIYSFQTPKRDRVRMLRDIDSTPSAVRNKMRKAIEKTSLEDMESDSDPYQTDSGSDYTQSDSEDSTSSEEVGDFDEETTVGKREKRPINIKSGKSRKASTYVIKTDDYFANHSAKKNVTSNHTLDKLETPRLPQNQLLKLIRKMELSKEHQKSFQELASSNREHFSKWLNLLQENFNILLYGLGTKRNVLKQFQDECLSNSPTIVINGFFPTLSINDITNAILADVLNIQQAYANPYVACDLIEEAFLKKPHLHLFLIVHNMEGDMLRNGKSQNVLSRLALLKNVHLVASIDHINAPLIWDHIKLSQFNFTWWDVTTYSPYIDETGFETSMLVQKSGTLVLSSLRNVFSSLTGNSKGIFTKILKYQLEHSKEQYYQGISFKDLYWSCRDAFLVSSDLALRAQLTEFSDHKMIKFRRSADGTEFLIIPLNNALLQQFLDEQNSSN